MYKLITVLLVFYLSYFVLYVIKTNTVFAFKKVTKSIKKTVTLLLVIATTAFFLTGPQIVLLPIIFVIYLLRINTQIVAPEDSEMVKKPITSDTQELVINLMSIPCKKGIKQFNMLDRKIQSFNVIISAQLDASELAFIRYTDTVDLVYLAVLHNLQQYYLVMTSIKTINGRSLTKRLMAKDIKNELTIKTLQQRLDLWKSQIKRAENILMQNEQTLHKLDLITSKIANIESYTVQTTMMETATNNLLEVDH